MKWRTEWYEGDNSLKETNYIDWKTLLADSTYIAKSAQTFTSHSEILS